MNKGEKELIIYVVHLILSEQLNEAWMDGLDWNMHGLHTNCVQSLDVNTYPLIHNIHSLKNHGGL
jgi:hypothetical protein